jgi:hypothetical protein
VASPYVQITLNPGSTISGTFQQNITFNPSTYSAYESSDLGNIRFCTDPTCSSGYLDSWLEGCPETACSNQSSSQAIFWVKLPNGETQTAPGNTIYMVFEPLSTEFDVSIAGEAPQISSTYAEYDNGASVFTNYWNFAGTSLPTGFTTTSGLTATVNNGVSFSVSSAPQWLFNPNLALSGSIIIENYMEATTASSDVGYGLTGVGIADSTTPSWTASFAIGGTNMNSGATGESLRYGFFQNGITDTGTATALNVWYLQTFTGSSSGMSVSNNYVQYASTSTALPSTYYIVAEEIDGGTAKLQWLRTRAYPPNGVMPTPSFGSVQ